MMKSALTILLLLSCLFSKAQTHQFGIKSGIAKTMIESSFDIPYGTHQFGYFGGLTYEYVSPLKLTAGAELQYQQRGLKEVYSIPFYMNLITTEYHYNYLTLVAKGGVQFGKKGCFYFNLGLTPSYLLTAKSVTPNADGSIVIIGGTDDFTSDVKRFDVGGMAEIGGGFGIGEKIMVCGGLSYQKSLTSITTDTYFKDETIKHYAIAFCLGVKYRLVKAS